MSGGEDEGAANVEAGAEPILSHPDYEFDHKVKRYRERATGQIASRADVEKAIEASTAAAAAEAKAKADKMAENYHKIRLPPWNPAKPKLWFQLCEDVFDLAGIKATEQKPRAVLVQRELPGAVTATVEEYITNPKEKTRYDDLKKAVLAQHQQSPEEAWVELNRMTLGDQKPSALGQAMLALHPYKCGDDATTGCPHKMWHMENFLKAKLPQTVRNGLVATKLDVKNPTEYFAKADELMASVRAKQQAVNEVTKGEEVDAVGTRGGGKARGNKQRATKTKDVCWTHARYKRKTWKCMEPTTCKFANQLAPKPEPTKKEQKE